MEIVVCLKQVPASAEVKIDPQTGNLVRGSAPAVLNPYDRPAIETAVRLREAYGGRVTALTMGPPEAAEVLREAVSLRVDDGVLLSDPQFAGADTLATSYTLAQGIRRLIREQGRVDLVICGQQSTDGETAQVGPELGEALGWPEVSFVRHLEVEAGGNILVERVVEGGLERLRLPLPAVVTVVKGILPCRVPSLKGMFRARKMVFRTWGAGEIEAEPDRIGAGGSPTRVSRTFAPERIAHGQLLEGSLDEQVRQLVARLVEKKVL